jgi:hypothetical protein
VIVAGLPLSTKLPAQTRERGRREESSKREEKKERRREREEEERKKEKKDEKGRGKRETGLCFFGFCLPQVRQAMHPMYLKIINNEF